jgi:agmatine deiminase
MSLYVSKILKEQYPLIAKTLDALVEIDTTNIWARDYMPIKTGGTFTKFRYKTPKYDQYAQLGVARSCWDTLVARESDIVLDGGNVEQNKDLVLITDVVFEHNSDILREQLICRLQTLFQKKVVFVPVEPEDDLGHIDGIVKFLDDRTVFMNDYSAYGSVAHDEYQKKVEDIMMSNGLSVIHLPNTWHKTPAMTEDEFRIKYPLADDFNPGYGYYINFLVDDNKVFVPIFGIPEDNAVLKIIDDNYCNKAIIPVDCFDLSMTGGLVHCVTWED